MGLLDNVRRFMHGNTQLNVKSRFELLREAVSGTMSQFYMVREKATGRVFGLKILDLEKTAAFESRFIGLEKPSEGEIASKFDHPLIVKTYEYGMTTHGEHYLLMEFLEGRGLNSLIHSREPTLAKNPLKLIRQMAEALSIVHSAGYIHRDICPRNFICSKDTIKLIDFGLTVPATKEFMQPGNRTGTPNYMAPEVLRRRQTDQRLDLFALGVSCFQLCALELPWPTQDTSGKAAVLHDTQQPAQIRDLCPDINPILADLIQKCLAKDPADRPQSIESFKRELTRIRET